ncbi:hypothetical protein NDI56_16225 [Haloarcula sp. S1CR25-12]|uniref:Acetyl-CoA synthetase n=1 Tax=Haloarcula saliterrae TaxID=2950534 RepID=A0ABU2FFC2_9EURY|nr:hypothetical protein [Haloarcula sp. S1CR25-12]MDS0260949.1 hypothetical protein [Haloarcula sp. S1CR25-12]
MPRVPSLELTPLFRAFNAPEPLEPMGSVTATFGRLAGDEVDRYTAVADEGGEICARAAAEGL